MVSSILAGQGRIDDPHLWERAREFGLDLDRFEADRRSDDVLAKVRDDFRLAIRAGVATTPSFLVEGEIVAGVPSVDDVNRWAA